MKKAIILIVVLAAFAAIIFIDLKFFNKSEPVFCTQDAKLCPDGSYVGRIGPNCEFAPCPQGEIKDYKNISYEIEGQIITLKDGLSEREVTPGSASKSITQYFGNEARGDFNGDGLEDIAFLLTQNNGGSGTFYYVVAALKTAEGYKGTNGISIGDRIAPQTTEFINGEIVVNYADRKPGEPFSTPPSVGVSKYFKVVDSKLAEIAK